MFSIITKPIDNILNKITMYRLVLYYLIVLWLFAFCFSFFKLLPFNAVQLLISSAVFLITCWIFNKVFSKIFNVITNLESVYISAFILILLITPAKNISDYLFIISASIITISSKFIIAFKNKHFFNPVAIAVFITSIISLGSASWWIGTSIMLPIVFIGGLLILRKIQRFELVSFFLLSAFFVISLFSFINGFPILETIYRIIFDSPIIFFSFVMLTEPLTMPPRQNLRIYYGVLVGLLFSPQLHFGNIYTTPENSLLIGNIFSYLVGPKDKIISAIQQKIQIAPDMIDFLFIPKKKLSFSPGQYMEWTISHKNPDSRGNRRYFTIASSPTENELRLGVKFYQNGSSYKKAMAAIDINTPIVGAQLSGDFTLPEDIKQKLVFIAGGIGITPFRSMIKYLIDLKQQRPIILFYANKTADEIVYSDVFNQAQAELGLKTIYTLTDQNKIPLNWSGKVGRIDANMIIQEVPDFMERIFYLSGPHAMVTGFEEVLKNMGVNKSKIKKDFFPGFV